MQDDGRRRTNTFGGSALNLNHMSETYLLARRRGGARRGTIANLRWALDSFTTHIGNRPIGRIGEADIERWLETCGHYSPASRRAMLSAVRGFLHWAERRKYIRHNPANHIRGPRQPRTLPRALTGRSAATLVAACPDSRARLIVILMLQQGLRCCEVSRLELADIDRYHKTMRVRGKGDHERILPLMDETVLCLNAYLGEYPCTAGPLIRSYVRREALTPGAISRLVSRWMLDAGVKTAPRDGISAHSNRHTAASDMLLAGAHLRDVQAALGHAHLATTETYLPLVVNGLGEAMAGRSYTYPGRIRP